ncbi:M50 family metallopeptidase [[Clostridium] colinum]|uniref:M50 family metallopeptidase n=1 Tax=[Clostridium] colinum TaxID=36835 RepID=UPI0020241394|nr:M50 family metallopeptidase [[Clostridium] colinum]
MSLIITILIFGFIILVHEWGHFIVARKSGVFVEEFAIGMGTKLWSKEKDGTLYSVRLFPLGGYCKMKDEDSASDDPDSFSNATMPKKFAIIFAGAFMNFVLAFAIFIGITFFSGTATTTVREVTEGSPAQEAGIQPKDVIYKLDGKKIRNFEDLTFQISRLKEEQNKSLELIVKRDGQKIKFNIKPEFDKNNNRYLIGISPVLKNGLLAKDIEGIEKNTFFGTIRDGYNNMIFTIKVTIIGVFDLFSGQIALKELTGPIGITPVIDKHYETAMKVSVSATILTMLNIMALLSANIGVFNLLPIPALDGGRIVFLTIEAIRGKPISPEKEGMVHFIGFVILMGFGILIAFKDVINLF